MSHVGERKMVTLSTLNARKSKGEKITAITCYDSAFAKLIELSPVDFVLVGDSMGNVILGQDDTIPVTVDDIVHHTRAVSRVLKTPFLCADMPFMSYATVDRALDAAQLMFQKGRAHAVKLEGGAEITPQVRALTAAGVPVVGHLGFTPQSVHALGGYRVQGRGETGKKLVEDAKALVEAGVRLLVLEMVPAPLAKEITKIIPIPTIGIGAGPDCDGQILVLHDMLGFDETFRPKFLKTYQSLGELTKQALAQYDSDVKTGQYPAAEHSFQE
jgi:3-methyl-2-oxobutanoate hydroxymethyltransferase